MLPHSAAPSPSITGRASSPAASAQPKSSPTISALFPAGPSPRSPLPPPLPIDQIKNPNTAPFSISRSDGAADNSTRPPKLAARLPLSEVRESPPTTTLPPADSGEPMLRPTPPPSGPVLLEDDFDEAVLREIDEICDRRSATKGEKPKRECSAGGGVVVEDGETLQEYVEYWKKLNEKQREAACSDISVPLMIVAGPGSGKTSTMVGRVLMLLKEGIPAKKILAMTFTTAAAAEMRDRIGGVVGKAVAHELEISTFHSFCLQFCRLHADKLGRTTEFVVYGHGQQRRAIIEAMRISQNPQQDGQCFEKQSNSTNVDSLKERSKKWEKLVIQAKASGKAPDDFRKMGDELGATILSNYNDILTSCNALDYHDFITSSVMLLTEFPEVFKQCQELWRAIVVDEFQDTSCMQYKLLKILGSHHYLTVIGDEDQSIFSFNGADICGFDSFRKDFPNHKEIRLTVNYRSTRCIVEAASSLIHYNIRRCQSKCVDTDNSSGCKITVKECNSEAAQCACVADKILEIASTSSLSSASFGEIAVLYRRQVTGKAFQALFRERKIPFNVHGVAFYRKKVIKAIIAILGTTLPGCGDGPYCQSFKALLNCDKEEKKKVIEYIEKIAAARKCSFFAAATDIFSAKLSGTFKRAQLSDGRRVLSTLDMLSKLVQKEQSITTVVSSTAAVIPQKYLLEKQAIVDIDSGKYLNEDRDPRSALQYLLHDVSEFLSRYYGDVALDDGGKVEVTGCGVILKAFLDYICPREAENFRVRKCENKNSVTLTTIHQSKGLEWNTVFIVKANESEIPLLHEYNGILRESAAALEEERRLLYVAMTRARQKLYVSYILMDSNWQLLQPSRFLREIPNHLIEDKADENPAGVEKVNGSTGAINANNDASRFKSSAEKVDSDDHDGGADALPDATDPLSGGGFSNVFLKGFDLEGRAVISHMFHQWAKKPAFQNVRRLLDKVGFVIDERLRRKTNKNKEILRLLKAKLGSDEAFQYAQQVLRWEQLPMEKRIHLTREKQEHFQKLRLEKSMDSSEATPKQISYLRTLGCTVIPTSRLHASHLIELYKSI